VAQLREKSHVSETVNRSSHRNFDNRNANPAVKIAKQSERMTTIKSIQVALANETPAQLPAKPAGEMTLDRVQLQTDATGPIAPAPLMRRVAIL
jgi:hypothetical protein